MNSLKAKKGLGNIVTGLFNQLVTIALGILIPRLILTSLGSEANGLLSSVNQVLAYLALLEAGIGTASMQALYGIATPSTASWRRHTISTVGRGFSTCLRYWCAPPSFL